ncbi:transcription-repair coupling factor [Orenia metallireducens]|uniref:Transcription-repair-coupling factor n=1 Tax=Orenia metallireducens TaxID=1413210 RepID=A0A1C0A6K7_9FIRM|nr:transcription-repair coupling factor [Orenia metallireducens]OCL25749.1 transcription-repair coupling factor [Orenia metallireducens]
MGQSLLNLMNGHIQFEDLLTYYHSKEEVKIIGLDDSSQNFFLANLKNRLNRGLLIVASTMQKADDIYEDLTRLVSEDAVLLFPRLEILPHESLEIEQSVKAERLRVLNSLVNNEDKLIVAPIQALLEVIVPYKVYKECLINLSLNQELDIHQLSSSLVEMGYERVDIIESKGQFSVRGGIVDFYPYTVDNPIRIELFGDEIESIRNFDLGTQISKGELSEVELGPATEFIIPRDKIDIALNQMEKDLEKESKSMPKEARQRIKEITNNNLEQMKEGIYFPEVRQYLNYFYQPTTLLDYFNDIIIFDNPIKLKEAAIEFLSNISQSYSNLLKQGRVLESYKNLFIDFGQLIYRKDNYKLYLSPITKDIDFVDTKFTIEFNSRRLEAYQGKIQLFVDKLKGYFNDNYKIVIGLSSKSKAKKLKERLQEVDLPAKVISNITDELKLGNIVLTVNNLSNGFILPDIKFIFYTENEIFKKNKRKRKRVKAFDQGVKLSSFTDLKQGDYVVHENHGIGKYLGIKTLTVQGKNKDYLVLLYAKDDKLYIPTEQVDLIQKYVGLQDKEPKLHKLDGDSWNKAKARVKQSVEEMAEELLELYAKRELQRGYSFGEDTIWQQEFEEEFPYQETPDQIKAIEAVKDDMESEQPMDRLLCGDVGYGKTEVAIRAIFKAIMDGKQAVFLVPTTILAQQHWNNLVDRFADYPINVEMLSRFRTAAEQKSTIEGLADGSVDLVIGTHRLLSSDIKFKDLGLVIVDEEQRFGVKQKERLKRLKESVDVLTLTATPIPRTLHMSLVGVRDISLIETPPENRYPIRTFVGKYDEDLIQDAIQREINRGGQVYFVHNRVKDIRQIAAQVQRLVPDARVAIAHGQMSELKLEELMLDFLEGNFDVLVCTTIIETGMDISNVNTIIINEADKLGLSQLYQLRGRVGRTNRIAYAYLLYKPEKILSEIAEKRLKAIKEFTNLGSGFKIAMRDLEIRGAGNILGPEQHGHIEAIGFSLYCKLLEEAVKNLKNEGIEEEVEISLELKVDAYIPDEYISDSRQKIEVYKKIDAISDMEEYNRLKEELKDRFGDLKEEVIILLELAKIKVKGREIYLAQIKEKGQFLELQFTKNHFLSGEKLISIIQEFDGLKFVASNETQIKISNKNLTDQDKVNLILDILNFLSPQ